MKTDFRDIKQYIRRRIVAGDWAPGQLVPNEVDLAAQFECARATVNRAMRELAEEGLVERRRKAGTRVRSTPLHRPRFEIPFVRKEVEALGSVYGYRLIDRAAGPAPGWLKAQFGLETDIRALHLVCLHLADGAPYQIEDRWISLAALPDAEDNDFTEIGPNEWLISVVPFSDAEISFSAIAADAEAAERLGCAAGDALFLTERSTWWNGQAITYVRLISRPGHKVTARY